MNNYDFGGWATKYGIVCTDGRTISKDAFKHCDELEIPLIWNHTYTSPENVIGKAILKHSEAGVYAYCSFNNSQTAEDAKQLVVHGDITALSIYANKLQQVGGRVMHGEIKEVSLVLAGANPGASIVEVLVHGAEDDSRAHIFNEDGTVDELCHKDVTPEPVKAEPVKAVPVPETVADVYNTMSEKQKSAVALIVEQLVEEEPNPDVTHADILAEGNQNNEGDITMKKNVFEQQGTVGAVGAELKHGEFIEASMKDWKKHGSLKESFIAHAADKTYGISNIGELFPAEANATNEPIFIDRDQTWVAKFFNSTKKSPFSRLRALYADITDDKARANGYITATLKKEEVFSLLKRVTAPTTIYKKQKLDRDDIVDITDFDVVSWMKKEMRGKLDEEIARAILIGDGRLASNDFKIKEDCIRPIFNDADLYTIKVAIPSTSTDEAKDFIKTVIKAMASYEGSGVPSLYTQPTMLADLLLLEDTNGRFIYQDEATLCRTLRVKEIVPVPPMNGLVRATTDSKVHTVLAVIVNPADYTVGADKGGAVAMFDDFDIDFNQQKYLMETRCSGSLLIPKTAITVEKVV